MLLFLLIKKEDFILYQFSSVSLKQFNIYVPGMENPERKKYSKSLQANHKKMSVSDLLHG